MIKSKNYFNIYIKLVHLYFYHVNQDKQKSMADQSIKLFKLTHKIIHKMVK
jgi:hypothetical protein